MKKCDAQEDVKHACAGKEQNGDAQEEMAGQHHGSSYLTRDDLLNFSKVKR